MRTLSRFLLQEFPEDSPKNPLRFARKKKNLLRIAIQNTESTTIEFYAFTTSEKVTITSVNFTMNPEMTREIPVSLWI